MLVVEPVLLMTTYFVPWKCSVSFKVIIEGVTFVPALIALLTCSIPAPTPAADSFFPSEPYGTAEAVANSASRMACRSRFSPLSACALRKRATEPAVRGEEKEVPLVTVHRLSGYGARTL